MRGAAFALAFLVATSVGAGVGRSQGPLINELPEWSPDGSKIAFRSSRGSGIWVMNADGSGQRRLTENPRGDSFPTWSPDGNRIAFARWEGSSFQIHIMSADGAGPMPITSAGSNFEPAWSPDGATIAFSSDRDGNREIYAMRPDGAGQTNLTSNPALDTGADWSPDGRRIVFASNRDGDFDIYVMNADGSGVVQVTNDPALEVAPSWSPDGTRLAFTLEVPGPFGPGSNLRQLHILNADGSDRRRIHTTALADEADWSPDGRLIAFELGTASGSDIHTVAPDGSGLRNLTRTSSTPASPTGACIVPNVEGRTLKSAKEALLRRGCRVGTTRRAYSQRFKRGRIVAQSRRPGARLKRHTRVDLVVSRGRRP
jgi:Tol biopolymer transport system component